MLNIREMLKKTILERRGMEMHHRIRGDYEFGNLEQAMQGMFFAAALIVVPRFSIDVLFFPFLFASRIIECVVDTVYHAFECVANLFVDPIQSCRALLKMGSDITAIPFHLISTVLASVSILTHFVVLLLAIIPQIKEAIQRDTGEDVDAIIKKHHELVYQPNSRSLRFFIGSQMGLCQITKEEESFITDYEYKQNTDDNQRDLEEVNKWTVVPYL